MMCSCLIVDHEEESTKRYEDCNDDDQWDADVDISTGNRAPIVDIHVI